MRNERLCKADANIYGLKAEVVYGRDLKELGLLRQLVL